ncbi:Uma2 family endonuclease [bacterium]|nr:MAG: Uma2 family endonuclease [bacterium]
MAVLSPVVSPREYLRREAEEEVKSELIDGQIVAMAGASRQHITLTPNLGDILALILKGTGCRRFDGDAKVWIAATGDYLYPDACVACPPHFIDEAAGAIDNPMIVFEVLSPSTEARDRGIKFERYVTLDSLREYVLISSERVAVETFVRQPDGRWLWSLVNDQSGTLLLESLDAQMSLSDLYVNWAP